MVVVYPAYVTRESGHGHFQGAYSTHAFLSVHNSFVVTCWERTNLLALLCVMFSCVFVTFPSGVLCQVWLLIVLNLDLCLLTYFADLELATYQDSHSSRKVVWPLLFLIKVYVM